MNAININTQVPEFELPSTDGSLTKLSQFKNKNIVLYFYPKDCTSGCTLEGQNFRDNIDKFNQLGAVVLGVSRDNLKLHHKFKTEQNFPFELLSDAEEKLCNLFNVIKQKNMYGKKVRGIERSTFLIDKTGKLIWEWRGVKVDGHVEAVLNKLKELV